LFFFSKSVKLAPATTPIISDAMAMVSTFGFGAGVGVGGVIGVNTGVGNGVY
jgi:hypothetical protein